MELTSKSRLPRLVKERIICEYLSGSETIQMLSEEYGMSRNAIDHMVSRHKSKFSPTFNALQKWHVVYLKLAMPE